MVKTRTDLTLISLFSHVITTQGKKSKTSTSTEPAPEIEQKRTLGLVILRGETIVSVSVEGPPPNKDAKQGPGGAQGLPAGLGKGVAAGRGMPLMPPGMFYRLQAAFCSRCLGFPH